MSGCKDCFYGRVICDECNNGPSKYLCALSSREQYKKGWRTFSDVCHDGKKICSNCSSRQLRADISKCCNPIKKLFTFVFKNLFGCFKNKNAIKEKVQ